MPLSENSRRGFPTQQASQIREAFSSSSAPPTRSSETAASMRKQAAAISRGETRPPRSAGVEAPPGWDGDARLVAEAMAGASSPQDANTSCRRLRPRDRKRGRLSEIGRENLDVGEGGSSQVVFDNAVHSKREIGPIRGNAAHYLWIFRQPGGIPITPALARGRLHWSTEAVGASGDLASARSPSRGKAGLPR